MNEQERYMQDFFEVFNGVERWGPGTAADTSQALKQLPTPPKALLEIGCGKGAATLVLANAFDAHITAIDNEQTALDKLSEHLHANVLTQRVKPLNMSMANIDFPDESFDTLWCETSIYVLGVEKALAVWKRLLKPGGFMVFNDLVWLTDNRSREAAEFWSREYPDMQTVGTRQAQIQQVGYELIDTFTMEEKGWHDFYQPLAHRLVELRPEQPDSLAFNDIATEIAIYEKYLSEFGYQFFIARKVG